MECKCKQDRFSDSVDRVKLDKVKAYPVDLVDRRFMWLKEDKKRDKHRKWEAQRREEEAIEKEHLLKQQELEYHMRKQLMTQPLVPRPDSAASTRNRRTSRLQSGITPSVDNFNIICVDFEIVHSFVINELS